MTNSTNNNNSCSNNTVNPVHLFVVSRVHVDDFDDVVVVELLQEHDLPVRALRVGGVVEGAEALLDGHVAVFFAVAPAPHDPVRAAAQLLHDVVPPADAPVNLLGHNLSISTTTTTTTFQARKHLKKQAASARYYITRL